jgi:hypothetical protein
MMQLARPERSRLHNSDESRCNQDLASPMLFALNYVVLKVPKLTLEAHFANRSGPGEGLETVL